MGAKSRRATFSVAALAACGMLQCSLLNPLDGFTGADPDDAQALPDVEAGPQDGGIQDTSTGAVDASTDAITDADAGSDAACPSGRGPAMVRVGAFCIDSTEVTRGEYGAFLASAPPVATQRAECMWNASFVPAAHWPPSGAQLQLPVDTVDWCDAWAFCAWAGKRLCGKIGGGAVPPSDFVSSATSQWSFACTLGGTRAYPYGATYDDSACNGAVDAAAVVPVGSFSRCVSYPGVVDMVGNVDEWEDSCTPAGDDAGGANDTCQLRGEGYGEATLLRCDADEKHPRAQATDDTGFRCCSP